MFKIKTGCWLWVILTALLAACPMDGDLESLRQEAIEKNKLTVSFEANGGTPAPASQRVSKGGTVEEPAAMEKDTDVFGGWYTKNFGEGETWDAAQKWNFDRDTVTGDMTLYARWVSAGTKFIVTFEANGGTPTPVSTLVAAGGLVTEPFGISKVGSVFGGWYTDDTLTHKWNFDNDTVIDDITLYARWVSEGTKFIVGFVANGGTPAPVSVEVVVGGLIPTPVSMTKGTDIFDGWYSDSTLANKWNFATNVVTDNMTLYARWIAEGAKFPVEFVANGGTPAPTSPIAEFYGAKLNEPTPMSKENHDFGGWYTEPEFRYRWNFASDTVTRGMTLYAKWNLAQYAVAFHENGGTPNLTTIIVTHGDKLSKPPLMSKTGFTFVGWYTDETLANEWNFDSPVTGSMNLYAKWGCTVTFIVNGGGPVPEKQVVVPNGKATEPDGTLPGYSFDGWYKEASLINEWDFDADYVTENITLYATRELVTIVPGTTLADKLDWLRTNALSDIDYTVEIYADESIAPSTLSYSGKNNVSITMTGIDEEWKISLVSNGSLFTVSSGVTLILGNNITLKGSDDNTAQLVRVDSGGTLVMITGSKITGNKSSSYAGGGVLSNGTFTMEDGEISGNTAQNGGGVHVGEAGTFTMTGGTISGNTTSDLGAGVYVSGTFIMGGTAIISGNTASIHGGGVHMNWWATFSMNGGTISGNTASAGTGGGVHVGGGGTFTMNGNSIISGNTAFDYGGGVWVAGTFIMKSGEIFGNTTNSSGGGVYVNPDDRPNINEGSIFTKTGGTITGYDSDLVNGNVVKNSSGVVQANQGHAVYVGYNLVKRKETTAGQGDNLSYDGTVDPPTYSGAWDY